jgi:hypothetical protein
LEKAKKIPEEQKRVVQFHEQKFMDILGDTETPLLILMDSGVLLIKSKVCCYRKYLSSISILHIS